MKRRAGAAGRRLGADVRLDKRCRRSRSAVFHEHNCAATAPTRTGGKEAHQCKVHTASTGAVIVQRLTTSSTAALLGAGH